MYKGEQVAEEIMALVDEYPSEPLSFERRQVLQKVTELVLKYSEEIDDESNTSYQYGYDDGYSAAQEESDTEIQDLEAEIEVLREEKDGEYQKGYDDGFDAATAAGS